MNTERKFNFRLLFICSLLGSLMLLPHWFHHQELEFLLKRPTRTGCVDDWQHDWIDCDYLFADGTWMRTRHY